MREGDERGVRRTDDRGEGVNLDDDTSIAFDRLIVYGIIFRPIPIDTQFIQSVTRNFESATRDQQRDYWTGGRTDVGRRPTDGSAMLTIQTCHGLTAGRQHI